MLSVSCFFSLRHRIQPRIITQRPARSVRRRKHGKLHRCPSGNKPSSHRPCSADFQVCCIAGFQTCKLCDFQRLADLEVGDTAGLETCATSRRVWSVGGSVKVRPLRHRPNNESGETEMAGAAGLEPGAHNSKWCAKTRTPATIFRSIRFSWLACQSRQAVMAPGRYGSNEPGRQRSWYQPNSMATTANSS